MWRCTYQLQHILEPSDESFCLAVLPLCICPAQELRQASNAAIAQVRSAHNWQVLLACSVKATIDPCNVTIPSSGQLLTCSQRSAEQWASVW